MTLTPEGDSTVKREEDRNHKCCHAEDTFEQPDEDGAELAREARVWKVYVKETDRWDAEKVDGWNKSLDVMLVFAALFSAISTTFLIESSSMLKQDPNEVSAAALLVISQVLASTTTNSSSDPLLAGTLNQGPFVPAPGAILINTLWYLSLSLSIATSFLAMLAKDWCYAFYADRMGHPYDQARKRQRKWMMIEHWKMQEVIVILPLLMHLSLLLFAIGLCLYVWDLSITPAVPVVFISAAALAFYVWSSFISSFSEYFPYTTIVSRINRFSFVRAWYQKMGIFLGNAYRFLIGLVLSPWFLYDLCRHPTRVPLFQRAENVFLFRVGNTEYVCQYILDLMKSLGEGARSILFRFSFNIGDPNLEDPHIISYSLGWLIRNCETPRSVAIALQAIAAATSKMPSEPLDPEQASLQIFQRLISTKREDQEAAKTYARALNYLRPNSQPGTSDKNNQVMPPDIKVFIWEHKLSHEKKLVKLIQDDKGPKYVHFAPNEDDLSALSISNTATINGLRVLDGECQEAAKTLNEIAGALFASSRLHPVASKALINAAALLVSCSRISAVSLQLAILCFNPSHDSGRESTPGNRLSTFAPGSVSGAVFVIYALVHNDTPGDSCEEPAQSKGLVKKFQESMKKFKKLFKALSKSRNETNLWTGTHCKKQLWLQCTRLLSSPNDYGIVESKAIRPLSDWCHQHFNEYLTGFLGVILGTVSQGDDPMFTKDHADSFLQFINLIDGNPETLTRHLVPQFLTGPLYVLLATITCVQPNNQRGAFLDWSLGSFPKLSPGLIRSLRTEVSGLGPGSTFVSLLGSNLHGVGVDNRVRHFSAIQLWQLLNLAGNASAGRLSNDQASLKEILVRELGLPTTGVGHSKRDLGIFIMDCYCAGWNRGVYSRRAIKCILETQEHQGYEDLAETIETTGAELLIQTTSEGHHPDARERVGPSPPQMAEDSQYYIGRKQGRGSAF